MLVALMLFLADAERFAFLVRQSDRSADLVDDVLIGRRSAPGEIVREEVSSCKW